MLLVDIKNVRGEVTNDDVEVIGRVRNVTYEVGLSGATLKILINIEPEFIKTVWDDEIAH